MKKFRNAIIAAFVAPVILFCATTAFAQASGNSAPWWCNLCPHPIVNRNIIEHPLTLVVR